MNTDSENNQEQNLNQNIISETKSKNSKGIIILLFILLLSTVGLSYICIKLYNSKSTLEEAKEKLAYQLNDKGLYINKIQGQKKDLENTVTSLTEEIEKLNIELVEKETIIATADPDVNPNSSTGNMNSTDTSSTSSDTSISKQTVTLSKGSYTVGVDIQPGIYDLLADSGFGLITGNLSSGFISEAIGISDMYPNSKTYNGLELTNGDKFTIKSSVTIKFISR